MAFSWVKKYEPSVLADIKGQKRAVKQLDEFISGFRLQKKKAAIIYGPPGCGKTASVSAMAGQNSYEFIEINASDCRNKDMIESKVGNALKQQSLFYKGKIILIDELDGLSGTKDRGGVPAVAKLIQSAVFPVVMTANNPWDKKFSGLRSKALLIEFQPLDFETVYCALKKICEKEALEYEDKALRTLARASGGDLRAAINDLQSFSNKKKFSCKDLDFLPERNREESMQNALLKIFKTSEAKTALSAFDNVKENLDKSMLWLDENLPYEYSKADLSRAYNALSRADVFLGRIIRRQHWRFLVYANALATAGVALGKTAKNRKSFRCRPTERILKLWKAKMKYQKRKAIAEKIAVQDHTSVKTALQATLPYVRAVFQSNTQESESLAGYFDFNEDEIAWLSR